MREDSWPKRAGKSSVMRFTWRGWYGFAKFATFAEFSTLPKFATFDLLKVALNLVNLMASQPTQRFAMSGSPEP